MTTPSRRAPAPYVRKSMVPQKTYNFSEESGVAKSAERVCIYSEGGMGKSTLLSQLPGVVVLDSELSTLKLDVKRAKGVRAEKLNGTVDGAESWERARAWVRQSKGKFAVGFDSITRMEDWCTAWVIKNRGGGENPENPEALEEFKYKSGTGYVVEEFKAFLDDMEALYMSGTHIVCICHADTTKFINPDGSNFFRFAPRLVDDEKKGSNMKNLVERMDHVIYIGLDVDVGKGGKATGSGTRTMYVSKTPTRVAKTRSLQFDSMQFVIDPTPELDLWKLLGIK